MFPCCKAFFRSFQEMTKSSPGSDIQAMIFLRCTIAGTPRSLWPPVGSPPARRPGISVILLYSIRRLSPFYFIEIALVAVFPLHLTGICGMIQDVFLFLFAAAMPEGSPARRQGNGSNTQTFLLETERTRYIWDSLRKFSERTVSGS